MLLGEAGLAGASGDGGGEGTRRRQSWAALSSLELKSDGVWDWGEAGEKRK